MLLTTYLLRNVPKKRLFGTLRVMGYSLVVCAGLGALTLRSAVASAEDQGLKVGRSLAELSDLVQSGTEFRLNGQSVFFSAGTSDDSVSKVLDRFEANCKAHRAFDAESWKNASDADTKNEETIADRMGVVRKEDPAKGDGMVMCFTSDKGPRDFYKALQAFSDSGDLSDLGDVRYAHVSPHRYKDGKTKAERTNTNIQTMWTNGSFNIKALIGPDGKDANGSDFVSLPRPMNSVRRFTADAVGQPYAARVYESGDSADKVLADYNDRMMKDDWVVVQNPVPEAKFPEGQDGRWYTKLETGEQAAIAVNANGNKTMVVIGSMGVLDKAPKGQVQQ
jgi:hypothetical protein